MAGGSPPVDIETCVVPDVLPIAMSVKTVMSVKLMEMDTPDDIVSRMEMTSGSPPVEIDINRSPDVLQISVTATEIVGGSPPADRHLYSSGYATDRGIRDGSVVRKVDGEVCHKPKVLCSDGLAPDDDPARRSSDVGSDACIIQDPIPTAVSVRTVVAEEWMDRFVLDQVECPSVSRTSVVARTFGPAMSEEYSPVVFAVGGGGGGGCRCMPPGCRRVRYSSGVWPTVV